METDEARGVLGVSVDATPETVRERYLHLAKVLHPDKGGSTVLFQLIALAYDALTGRAPVERSPPRPASGMPRPAPRAAFHTAPRPAPRAPPPVRRNPVRDPPVFVVPPEFPTVEPPVDHTWPGVRVAGAARSTTADDDDW
jgi:hypothetical protein